MYFLSHVDFAVRRRVSGYHTQHLVIKHQFLDLLIAHPHIAEHRNLTLLFGHLLNLVSTHEVDGRCILSGSALLAQLSGVFSEDGFVRQIGIIFVRPRVAVFFP